MIKKDELLEAVWPDVIVSESAVHKYAGLEQDALSAGREQRVDAVLEGSIQRVGERMRVTVRLLNVQDGAPLWAYQCGEQQCKPRRAS